MFCQIPLFLNLGTPELILIMFVVLLLFGGKKLPELARGLGKGLRDFKDASEGLKTEINNQINTIEEVKKDATAKIEEIAKEATEKIEDTAEAKPVTEQTAYHENEYNEGGYNEGGYNEGGYNEGGYHEGGYNEPAFQATTLKPESPAPEIQSPEPVAAKVKSANKKLKS